MNIKDNFAKNLIKYRNDAGLTQAELAEKINYSDKAVSKWERGEATPDLIVLKELADLFNTTIDNMIAEPSNVKPKVKKIIQRRNVILSLISVGIVWLIAILTFVLCRMFVDESPDFWIIFIYAIPISTIVFIIFSAMWGKNLTTGISMSILVWSLILSIFLSIVTFSSAAPTNLWLIFLIGVPLQIIVILLFSYRQLKFIKKSNKKNV